MGLETCKSRIDAHEGMRRIAGALLALACAAAAGRGRGRGRGRASRLVGKPLHRGLGTCCSAVSHGCGGNASSGCCTALTPQQALISSCARQRSRAACESARPAAHTVEQLGSTDGVVCAWLGGRCVVGTVADCAEPAPAPSEVDFYGEAAAFAEACGDGGGGRRPRCVGMRAAFVQYARAHTAATRSAAPVEGMAAARLLVVRDHWKNVGMGFMPPHVANLIVWAMSCGMYVYFENYGRYDWSRYFGGYAGLDLRWTPAKHRLWRSRFASLGVDRPDVVEVWREDGSGLGDEEWEASLASKLANRTCTWLVLDGWATTVNWHRVLRPAMRGAIEARLEATRPAASHIPLPVPPARRGAAPSADCLSCAVWALFRPRARTRAALAASPVSASAPLACLKGRTMYAEDKRFFPDETPLRWDAIDAMWTSYDEKKLLGDETFWGPRERLRCVNTSQPSAAAASRGGVTSSTARSSATSPVNQLSQALAARRRSRGGTFPQAGGGRSEGGRGGGGRGGGGRGGGGRGSRKDGADGPRSKQECRAHAKARLEHFGGGGGNKREGGARVTKIG